jgi:sugar/nucleoside kinase (ribokinase family)
MSFLVLGEALVDLICEQPEQGLAEAPAFVPHLGDAAANVAVTAQGEPTFAIYGEGISDALADAAEAGARAAETWGATS